MSRLSVMGESLVDLVGSIAHPGGSPLNVAVGLSRLGHEVQFHTEFGNDLYGGQILQHLRQAGVQLAEGSVTGRPTSTALVSMDAHGNAEYSFDIHQQIPALGSEVAPGLLHAGSIAAWIEPSGSTILDAFRAAGDATLLSYDPNLRPALVEDHEAALQRIEQLMALSHIVKFSDADARWLYPDLNEHEILEHVGQLGPALVVMTRGGAGCIAWCSSGQFAARALRTDVQDTIGAGDAFMSGLLHGVLGDAALTACLLERGAPSGPEIREVLHYALTSAALTVAQPGANPPTAAVFADAL